MIRAMAATLLPILARLLGAAAEVEDRRRIDPVQPATTARHLLQPLPEACTGEALDMNKLWVAGEF